MIKKEITDLDLVSKIESIEKDGMSVFVMADGRLRGALFHGTRFVNDLRAQHNLGILETMVLGQAALCGALLIPTMKGRGRMIYRYDTNGPAVGFSVEADSTGFVRGYLLQNPIPVYKPLESWDLAPFLGEGTVSVTRINEGDKVPQTGTVDIAYKNIAKDLAYYFEQSEQTKTAFQTSIQMDKAGRVIGAGGLFLQVMPAAGGKTQDGEFANMDEEELILRAENAFKACPSLGQWFSEKGNTEDIIYGLFREFKPLVPVNRDIVFDCPCNKENFVKRVRSLSKNELYDIKENGPDPIEVICHNCGSVYSIPVSEL